MHQISNSSIQAAQEHALIAQEHGKSVVSVAKIWNKRNGRHLQTSRVIEECGNVIQQYAQESLMYSKLVGIHNGSTHLYCSSVETHILAARTYIEAIKLYSQMVREKVKEFKP